MRTETIERNVYKFDELSDKAKENVRIMFSEYSSFDEAMNTLNAFADAVGITITSYSIDFLCSAHSYVKWTEKPTGRFIPTRS